MASGPLTHHRGRWGQSPRARPDRQTCEFVTWQGRDLPRAIRLRTVRREISLDFLGAPCHHKGPPQVDEDAGGRVREMLHG